MNFINMRQKYGQCIFRQRPEHPEIMEMWARVFVWLSIWASVTCQIVDDVPESIEADYPFIEQPLCSRMPAAMNAECCTIPMLFDEENFAKCGILLGDGQELIQTPDVHIFSSNCSVKNCMLKKHNVIGEDDKLSQEKFNLFMDKWEEKNKEFTPVGETMKKVCWEAMVHPTDLCEIEKLTVCYLGIIHNSCPVWKPTERCNKLKEVYNKACNV